MTDLDSLRRKAKLLRRAYGAADSAAAARVHIHVANGPTPLKHADFLHVIAREAHFDSWPRLKLAVESQGMDRAAKQQRLKIALAQGQNFVIDMLLNDTPDLANGLLGLEIALYDLPAVRAALAADAGAATKAVGPRRPIHHLAFSRYIHLRPDLSGDMIAIAALLVATGADVNDALQPPGDSTSLSPLYGAISGNNIALAEWLLTHGADPNDGESLYHATELRHHEGLRLLLAHGARPAGTNALPRALDFNDHEAVQMLLKAGADPNEANRDAIPALPHAARRMCDGAMVRLLLDAGADLSSRWQGLTAFALARVYGNVEAARLIAEAGGDTELSHTETLLADAAQGLETEGAYLDPATLLEEYRNLLRGLQDGTNRLNHIRALVALGLEYDRPDAMGVTPVQYAGWSGQPDMVALFLELRPDLGHVNRHGGSLLTTIIHGSENAPFRDSSDHIACARLALEHGVALPRNAADLAGDPDMRVFLKDWATAHPGQVVGA